LRSSFEPARESDHFGATELAPRVSLGGRQDTIPGARRRTSLCGDAPGRHPRHDLGRAPLSSAARRSARPPACRSRVGRVRRCATTSARPCGVLR